MMNTLEQQKHHPRHRQAGRRQPHARAHPRTTTTDPAGSTVTHDERPPRDPPRPEQPAEAPAPSASAAPPSSRRAKFGATLTKASEAPSSSSATVLQHEQAPPAEKPKPKPKPKPRRTAREQPPGDDLTSTLTRALRTPPYPDCSICFNPIRPEHPAWSCSPPTSTDVRPEDEDKDGDEDRDGDRSHCCWNTFHLKCIRAWAEKSVKELEEAWRTRGESRPGQWHCPACRATRQAVPHTYMCFCLRMRNPAPPRIATPHSCAQPCSRPRSTCRHACPLPCHPGPCPPCAVTIQVACFCGRQRHSAKCQLGMTATLSFSCAHPCQKQLQCGHSDHRCAEVCHEGPCPPCPMREEIRCWCGRETKRVACGEVSAEDSTQCVVVKEDGSEEAWTGNYGCGRPCERPFACSHHSCSKPCHPPSRSPPPCPFDPERVVSCACGRCNIAHSSDELAANSKHVSTPSLPPRTSCTSPLPTCTSPCSKLLSCGHLCLATCHWDPCPPCIERVERTCRCGATKHKIPCGDTVLANHPADGDTPASEGIICDRRCQATRFCGRHQCGRICCPLGPLQRAVTKPSKQRDPLSVDFDTQLQLQLQLDPALRALHECDLPCGRVLGCGNHRCSERDHKGPCKVCPRGVFDELVCLCGRTVLDPPIQCGTRLRCVYPCARPEPACGHPHVPHPCHEGVVIAGVDTADDGLAVQAEAVSMGGGPCPPCPFLTEKVCACGKKRVGNVRCSQERVSCGSVCGKLLTCGFHHCERPCHGDACGTCTAVCGKPRKSCLPESHPCTQICHAPAACPETEPCLAPVTHTCPCGNLRSTVPCSGTKLAIACTGECEIKKRNARLADALGISEEKREAKTRVTWSVELVAVARGLGPRFVGIVERAFADFITSDRRTQVLPHMPLERRKFVHDLASVYRMDTVTVDQEPHRSVQLIRRIDTRMPVPLLSQHVASTGASIGRLISSRAEAGKGTSASVAVGSGNKGSAWSTGTSGTGTDAGAGVGGWSAVAKSALGTSRPGSATPGRVPSPAVETATARSYEASPGPSQVSLSGAGGASASSGSGTRGGAWMSPLVRAQRERENAAQAVLAGTAGALGASAGVGVGVGAAAEDIPDDWENDV